MICKKFVQWLFILFTYSYTTFFSSLLFKLGFPLQGTMTFITGVIGTFVLAKLLGVLYVAE